MSRLRFASNINSTGKIQPPNCFYYLAKKKLLIDDWKVTKIYKDTNSLGVR